MCIPHLKKSVNPHILNLSPPLNMSPHWFQNHVAYTMAKYGMSMCVLGMAEEFRRDGIAVNALWPRTGEFDYGCLYVHSVIPTEYLFKDSRVLGSSVTKLFSMHIITITQMK